MNFKKNKFKKLNKNNIKEKFDIVIIGGGQTGIILACHLIKKELKTLIIDKDDLGIKTSLDLKNFTKIIKRMISRNEDPKKILSSLSERISFINKEQNLELLTPLKSNSFFHQD